MKKEIITPNAPKAIGPYSQAIKAGEFIYVSGQIPLDPHLMTLVSEDFRAQAIQVMRNLKAIAQAAGAELEHIIKLTIYLSSLGDFTSLNEVMMDFFNPPYPARVTFEVSALPKNAKVEIDAILHLPNKSY